MEGEVGRFRRNRLSPVPEVDSLAELNDRIRGWEAEDGHRRIADRIRTLSEDFAAEQPMLAQLPSAPFDSGPVLTSQVDRSSLITVRMVKYSVPVRFIGRNVRVSLRAAEVRVFDRRTLIATHPRIAARTGTSGIAGAGRLPRCGTVAGSQIQSSSSAMVLTSRIKVSKPSNSSIVCFKRHTLRPKALRHRFDEPPPQLARPPLPVG